ncbi:MAG: hypothetical protein PHQ27_10515 [Victivallales bacterium]|nr:hypothetical protein [Victivallales bacterium]
MKALLRALPYFFTSLFSLFLKDFVLRTTSVPPLDRVRQRAGALWLWLRSSDIKSIPLKSSHLRRFSADHRLARRGFLPGGQDDNSAPGRARTWRSGGTLPVR